MNDTSTLDLLLWVVLPYMVLAVFVLGHVWRFRADRFGWTTRSSQIYESKLLSIGSPMFHFGIIGIFVGHVVGLGIPKSWTRFFGISDHVGEQVYGLGLRQRSKLAPPDVLER